jgi:hypothetical protein
MRSGRSFWREDEGLFIDINRNATANREKAEHRRERYVCSGHLQQERSMLKTLITVSTVLLTTAAFAQSSTKSPGSSEYAPGQKMQKSKTSKAPGASEYAPGHQKNTAKGPGHSESAPGQQTTGSAAKKKY